MARGSSVEQSGQLRAVGDIEFAEDRADLAFDGLTRAAQAFGDGIVAQPRGDQPGVSGNMRLGVTNLFDRYGPNDSTMTWYPFYQNIYGIQGRAIYVNLDIDF